MNRNFLKTRMQTPSIRKKGSKDEREKQVLLGLVELFIATGKPVGSHTLKECGFGHLSSATIRNYFSKLEEENYLIQHHASGGRVPTPLAYRLYADESLKNSTLNPKDKKFLKTHLATETKEVVNYLQKAAESISELTACATFLSSARFDQDFISDIKLVPVDEDRSLCVLITDFGLIHTEILRAEKKLGAFSVKRIEAFFRYKLTGRDEPELSSEEEAIAKRFYSEIMLRHIVGHTHFTHSDIYKTGFSRLLHYEDFADVTLLANALALFENDDHLRAMLADTQRLQNTMSWIGEDLAPFLPHAENLCTVITIPYTIHHAVAGAIGIVGPLRMPYKEVFAVMQTAADLISQTLTKSVYKFKISFRKPRLHGSELLDATMLPLLENKPRKEMPNG